MSTKMASMKEGGICTIPIEHFDLAPFRSQLFVWLKLSNRKVYKAFHLTVWLYRYLAKQFSRWYWAAYPVSWAE